MSFRILNAGDTALTIEFGEHIERRAARDRRNGADLPFADRHL